MVFKFVRRSVRDIIYERRFELFSRNGHDGGLSYNGRGNSNRGQLAPLFVSEPVTPEMQHMYLMLPAARRPENGGKIASVFCRRGRVFCHTSPLAPTPEFGMRFICLSR